MKKLNNKGFAISTMLYSLIIMVFLIVALLMGIMSSNRQNNKSLVTTIEDELNRYSLTSTEFVPTSSASGQEYIVPYGQAGWYKIELWGAAGGSGDNAIGGAGAYTSGLIYLEENTLLFFYVGGIGSGTTGGVNGGGKGDSYGKGGGGATDVRLIGGDWNEPDSLNTRIMVAGGGGGAYDRDEDNKLNGQNAAALAGAASTNTNDGGAGTQIAGGTSAQNPGTKAAGGAGTAGGSGGGGGYYGGGGGKSNRLGGGGSSFISGYAGVAVEGSYENKQVRADYFMNGEKRTDYFYFIDGMMSENANLGAGKAKIELISTNSKDNPPTKKTSDLDSVRYIKDCLTGIGTSTAPQWLEIQAMRNGENLAHGKSTNYPELTDGKLDVAINRAIDNSGTDVATVYNQSFCQIIDLGDAYNLDEIAIWHNSINTTEISERTLQKHTIEVSTDQTNWQSIRSIGELSQQEPTTGPEDMSGMHISAWDLDASLAPLDGTYYIYSALLPNSRLLTAQSKYTNEDGYAAGEGNIWELSRPVSFKGIDGTNLQKWVITKVTDATGKSWYKIIEKETQQALQISDNNGANGSQVNTSSEYNDVYIWTHWNILPLKDGTYRIRPVSLPSADETEYTYLSVSDNNYTFIASAGILKKYSSTDLSQRFYIVNAGS